MFLRRITVQNLGPIEDCDVELPFHDNGDPKPVVVVGENGSGKSILLSLIVNFLLTSKRLLYDDTEIEQQRVYKIRSPLYVASEKHYYLAKLLFDHDFQCLEWQLRQPRKEFEANLGYTPNDPEWDKIPESETSVFWSNSNERKEVLKGLVDKNALLYFPANRFEEPAWLNIENLRATAQYSDLEHSINVSNRRLIQYAPLKANQNWLLDILFDRNAFEQVINRIPLRAVDGTEIYINAFSGYNGRCSIIYESVSKILKVILRSQGNLRLGFGDRSMRHVSLMRNERQWIPNLFQLSSGQALVLDLFLTIIRDYDLTQSPFSSLDDISGLVLIDEIELHLHSVFQYEVLPSLIKLFPKVQFVITSHSPLFLLGMERVFTKDGFCVVEMPSGRKISTETFSEFENAYNCFKETSSHAEVIRAAIEESQKPLLFLEGDYDIRYFHKAAELLGRTELLEKFLLMDGGGFGNLDKVWKRFHPRVAEALSQTVVLLYDCDTNKQDAVNGRVVKKAMRTQEDTPIGKGIENLFPETTIHRAEDHKRAFIDFTPETTKLVRGEEVRIDAIREVNKDEKGNLCDWLCEAGTAEDFVNFQQVFSMLEGLLNTTQTQT